MKRGLYVALGVILLLAGIALAVLGTVVALSVGSDDAISTAPARVRGTGVAVVAEGFRVDTSSIPVPDDLGTLTLTVTGRGGGAVFVGAARPSDIDTYLTGAPYDVVVDLSAGEKATTRKVPGSQQPQPPDSQGFWTAKATGAPAVLTARIPDGRTLVVMNADATTVVDADVVVTLRVARVWTYSWIAVGVGVALALLAGLLFWRARVAGRRRREAAEAAAPPVQTEPAAVAAPVPVAPIDDDVVAAPPSAALAALVVAAAGPPDDATIEVPVVTAVLPEETAEPVPVAPEPPVEGDAAADGADPLFEALVAEHGADPVHDELPPAPPPGGTSGGDASSAPTTGG